MHRQLRWLDKFSVTRFCALRYASAKPLHYKFAAYGGVMRYVVKFNFKIILGFIMLVSSYGALSAPFWSQPSHLCPEVDGLSSLVEATPAIRVPPNYPYQLAKKKIQGCVILSYALSEENGNPNKLVPKNIKAIASTNSAFQKESIKALKRWLFLAKTQPASVTNNYYSYFVFTLENQ